MTDAGAVFGGREKYDAAALRMLKQYENILGQGCVLEFLQLSENLSYLVKDSAGERRAVLRLSRPGYHTCGELRAELRWMERLAQDTDLILRQPIADGEGRYIQTVAIAGDEEQPEAQAADAGGCYGVLFTYMEGTPLEEEPPEKLPAWYERLGEITAVLHGHARRWEAARLLPRFRWNYETMLGKDAIWGDWRSAPQLTPGMSAVLERADGTIRGRLSEYGMTRENYGLIHGDLRGSNILIDGERMGVIDFDDCGFGWYMQDLAASLSFLETEEFAGELIRAWLAGYQKRERLGRRDKEMIDTFLVMRRMQLLAWTAGHGDSCSVRKLRDGFAERTVRLAERYGRAL